MNSMKGHIDSIKSDVQDTIGSVKDTVSEAKSTFKGWKRRDEVGVIHKEGNAFVVRENGEQIGEITFMPDGENTWVLNHTYVSPDYRGGDIARRLLNSVVEAAREEGKKIVPLCSYALVQFKRNADYADVWRKS
ncbi:GNAT family N-acetyltransferase [Cohnella rhizosphaerae]|uniref:N-acetyltransferase n=1 Tax=Cohnella rhizosphaerae TaxID=1457232 RepID=A0A9X4QTL6_9BACL|nr:GNAT family N-acetyltransferase [Cohnella rhizosphaerae]MDG0809592.1 N-acetyltransferase [Cohnella rhizosphaerae]